MGAVIVVATINGGAPMPSATKATASVGGFIPVSINRVRVTTPAGVASEGKAGTEITLEAVSAPIPNEAAFFATAEGTAIELTPGSAARVGNSF